MTKRKLQRFDENRSFPNMFFMPYEELMKGFPLKGKWRQDFFNNNNQLILELGCGKGEYTTGLARRYPENNYIGIDVKGARLWRGCKTSNEENMSNVAFLRAQIGLIQHYFAENEVSGLWITFPDPQPKRINEKNRLTSPNFLNKYRQILHKEAVIKLKTDNTALFEYTLKVIEKFGHKLLMHTFDLYNSNITTDAKDIQTHYEKMFLAEGVEIKYLEFQLNPAYE